jgi:hypothetical protein
MDSNRVRVSGIKEATIGVLPATPRMRTARITGESLQYSPQFFTPAEIRSDRMNSDPTKINETIGGGLNFEFSYPVDKSLMSEMLQSAFFNTWIMAPQWDNSETTSSLGAITVTTTIAVVDQSGSGGFAGTSVKAGHLFMLSGATNAGNNAVFKCASSTATTIVTSGLTNETLPTTGARLKVVGFEGASADITATATGLGSTTLNFTTLGLTVGQWIKIGGTAVGTRFATSVLNDWVRIITIAATALTCDNLPTGWGVDSGTGKTIRCWFGDTLRNGTTRNSIAIEKSFLGQAIPTHILHLGQTADRLNLSFQTDQAITGTVEFMGVGASQGTTANGSSYSAAPTNAVFTGNASVGRIAEAGVAISTANWIRRVDLSFQNNLRRINGLGKIGAYELGVGEISLTGTLESYFSSNALYTKLMAGTISNLNARAQANNQAVILGLPRVTFTDGNPAAGGKNQDVTLPLQYTTSIDPITGCEVILDRVEYYEL